MVGSNKLIISLLILSLALSALGLITTINMRGITLTGGATSGAGSANVSITGAVGIELVRNYTDFDSGALDAQLRRIGTQDDNYGTFDSGSEGNGSNYAGCDGTEANCAFPFVVRNTGNVNASINISASAEASTWIGGNGAAAYFKGKNNESAACGMNFTGMAGFGEGSWTYLNATGTERAVCTSMDFRDTPDQDEIRIHLNLTIPSDAQVRSTGTVITIGATQAP